MTKKALVAAVVVVLAMLVGEPAAWADGTETLGPPSGITLATGSGTVTGAVGLARQQSGTIEVTVPGEVRQVLLYWEGQSIAPAPGDSSIVVNGTEVTGTLIGGPTVFGSGAEGDVQTSAFRADITGLGLVSEGANSLTVSGLSFNKVTNGAGVIVIHDDGSGLSDISLRDGVDFAFIERSGTLATTVAQTFTFTPSAEDRTANLAILASSVASKTPGDRPNAIRVNVPGAPELVLRNKLESVQGPEFDSLDLPVPIPAGADRATVQLFSEAEEGDSRLPASLTWITAAFSVKLDAPPLPLPDISVTKTADPTSVTEPGGDVTFSVVVTNHAPEAVSLTSLTDTDFGDLDGRGTCSVTPPPVLAASGGTYACAFTAAVIGDAGDPQHENTVTAVGTDSRGNTDTATDPATVVFTDVLPVIAIDKAVDRPIVRAGDTVTYSYAVTNPGVEPLREVVVTDDRCAPVTFVSGDVNSDGRLDLTETWRYTCTATISANTINVATAVGQDDDGNTVRATDTASVVVINPAIAIVKTATPGSGSPGQTITYGYVVTNPGNDPLSNIVLTDDKCSPVVFGTGDANGDRRLDTSETWTFSCSIVLGAEGASITNVGTVTGTDTLGGTVTAADTETVTVVLGAPPILRPGRPELPRTGIPGGTSWPLVGGGLLVLGSLLVRGSRRRHPLL